MESLWKLVWAFPLVIVLGVVIILVLRRMMPPVATAPATGLLALEGSLVLSTDATAHILKVEGESMLVVIASSGVTAVPIRTANSTVPALHASPWGRRQ